MARRFAMAIAAAGCALAGLACWRAPLRGIDFGSDRDAFRNEGHVDADEIRSEPVYRLVLIGDAGEPARDDPTLALLGEWANAHHERTGVVFLGDNLYPAGLQYTGQARARGEAILLQQIRATRARELFIPGNHDWGWTTFQRSSRGVLLNQQVFVESHGATFAPKHGCPGPVAVELLRTSKAVTGGLTVLALDLNWWLLPEAERPDCEGIASTDDFIARLRDELHQRRAENVVVVAHHPIRSGGPHGGYTRGFWTDLGVSLYYRAYSLQDLVEPHYEEMVKVLGKVLAENPPLAMVGGHDHSLQIIDGGSEARLVVVSGAASNVTGVTSIDGTLFAHAHKGFVVFDFYRARKTADGVLLVNVVETGRGKKSVFSLALDLSREKAPPQPVSPKKVPAP
jgi:Calcineurin-like phosphoesterase